MNTGTKIATGLLLVGVTAYLLSENFRNKVDGMVAMLWEEIKRTKSAG